MPFITKNRLVHYDPIGLIDIQAQTNTTFVHKGGKGVNTKA